LSPPSRRFLQIFNRYTQSGGEEASVHRVCRALSARHAVRQCLFDSRDWQGPTAPPVFLQALRMWKNPEALRLIREAHTETDSNVWLLHNLFPVASAGVYSLSGKLDVPVIQYIHNFRPFSVNGYLWVNNRIETAGLKRNFWPEVRAGSWQDSKLKTAWYALILRSLHRSGAYDRVNAWVAISEFMKKTFVEAGIPESKVFCIPHSWEITETVLPDPVDQGYYLFLGRISPEKGVGVLLDLWDALHRDKGGACPRLLICGEGPLADEVTNRAAANPKIEYKGKVNGELKQNLIHECRAMLAPSLWWEPLGLVTYEAYEHGKPMLAARSGGLAETVFHGKTGFLHQPGDIQELTDQILELEEHPSRAAEMGTQGRKWLETSTTKEQWLTRFNSVLDQVT